MSAERMRPIVVITVRTSDHTASHTTIQIPGAERRDLVIARTRRGIRLGPASGRFRRTRTPFPPDLPVAGELLADGPLADDEASIVALALDDLAAIALWHAVRARPEVLAVRTAEAANRAVAALMSGRTSTQILAQPVFSAPRLLADDSTRPPRAVRLVERLDSARGQWLTIHGDTITVDLAPLDPPSRSAVTELVHSYVPPPDLPAGSGRLLIGPANYAGQGRAWATAVTTNLPGWHGECLSVYPPGSKLSFASDVPMTSTEWQSPAARLGLALDLVAPATHVLLEAARPIIGSDMPDSDAHGWRAQAARADLLSLRESGRPVALLFHGSEVRDPHHHAALDPWSPFRDPANSRLLHRLSERVAETRAGVFDVQDVVRFVSTPDLLDYVPGARWLPVVVEPGAFGPTPPALESGRPVVCHAPTHSVLKGTEWVDPLLTRLDEQGVITYRRLDGIPPFAMLRALRSVDVVVDQIVLGGVGVFAAQAMATGRVVLAHLPESVRRRFPEPPPVVETVPSTLEEIIRAIAAAPANFVPVAAAGRRFARLFHDGRYSAAALHEEFLGPGAPTRPEWTRDPSPDAGAHHVDA